MSMQNNSTKAYVSVIVPIYKAEGTLEAAVKSIQVQTYKNIEIILVDDGSPDNSGAICDRLAQDDRRIKVIHKQNGGVSSARNEGIFQATSDFLCFVDADDEIDPTMVEKLVKEQNETGAQLVTAGITEYHEKQIKNTVEKDCRIDFAVSLNEQVVGICSKYIMAFSTAKLFLRKILVENNLLFSKKLVLGEDHLLVFQYLYYCDKISFINEPLYRYYCFNSNGVARFFPLFGQMEIFKAKENFIRKNCSKEVANEYSAKNALRNLIARFNYLAKRSIKDYEELSNAYDFYWPYIVPFLERKEVFLEDDCIWLEKNKNQLNNKDIKAIYLCVRKGFVKKTKLRRNFEEFLEMPFKNKVEFIIKKIHFNV